MKSLFFTFFLLLTFSGFCQTLKPVSFSVKAVKTDKNHYTLQLDAILQKGWHVYASDDSVNGLEAIQLQMDHPRLQKLPAVVKPGAVKFRDAIFEFQVLEAYTSNFTLIQPVQIEGRIPASLSVTVRGFAANQTEFLPFEETTDVMLQGGADAVQALKLTSIDLNNPAASCGEQAQDENSGLLLIFLLGIGGGLLALLTPCVFPMIPLTVSWFTLESANSRLAKKNGFLYALFIFLIYVLASIPFHVLGNMDPEIFNVFSTNVWVNLFFFVVFVVFALSFFGLFEITLPSGMANKTDRRSNLGSLGGIFFMALTLALVSFSCTGPILGTLLVGSVSSNTGAWALTAGMAGFGLALALPFGLFAMFPHWMKKLPKSGGWLDTVKKSLAFVELALALKFLSNADLVMHGGLLKREVFLGLWMIIAIALALYLLGVIRLGSTAKGTRIGRGRYMAASLVILFSIYLAPGLSNTAYARLNLLSGFPPPMSYSVYESNEVGAKSKEGVHPDVVNDYQAALKLSKIKNKPLLIDFTGWACVNCRKMEENVWTKPDVSAYIKENFILVSLYVDDRAKLPADEQFTYTGSNGFKKNIRTVGDLYATFQAVNFGQVTQPLYVVISPEETLMTQPVGYTPDDTIYLDWLRCGQEAFKKLTAAHNEGLGREEDPISGFHKKITPKN